jgi:hypothetical protein
LVALQEFVDAAGKIRAKTARSATLPQGLKTPAFHSLRENFLALT